MMLGSSELPILCSLIGLAELDDVHIGQWMISRPFVLGPLIGLAIGNFWLGVKMGILMELLTIEDLPVGNAMPMNGALATTSAILLCERPEGVVPAAAFPIGLILGALFRHVDAKIRQKRAWLTQAAHRALERNREIPFLRLTLLSLGLRWAIFSLFLYAAILFLAEPITWIWIKLPETARQGFDIAFDLLPWLGTATLIHAFRWRL